MRTSPRNRSRRLSPATLTILAALLLLALSLRSGIGSLSVLLPTVRDTLGFSPLGVSVLTTLAPLCFAVVGLGAGGLVLRFGVHRVTIALLAAITVGLLARAATGSAVLFSLATVVAMAGVAVGNVVLPPLAKRHFPARVPLVSSLYGAALVGGGTLASIGSVPVADAFGGWRAGLACWALLPVLALLMWLPTLRRNGHEAAGGAVRGVRGGSQAGPSLLALLRTRLGVAFVVCFIGQSAQAYVQLGWWGSMVTDAGAGDAQAGLLLGIVTGAGLPVTLALPWLIRLTDGGIALPVAFAVLTVAGWLGILIAPLALGGVAWATLLGLGSGAFTWILAMLGQRTRTAGGVSQLSALTQGVGYLGASAATFAAGVLHDATGSWDAALVMVIVLGVVIGVAGSVIARSGPIEDELNS